ncbi:MAG TPA: biotin--[acetyl-CoA-carboxylase] ligase, partial [Chloroflexi bacterium]|nr:biotin--[acetyl-CoA-carboxylase] ligase [Chloroflexota bacterium]
NKALLPAVIDELRYYASIASTNTEASRLIEQGQIRGNTLLLAEEQTAGRGRLRRTWLSDPHDSLTFSLAIHGDHLSVLDNPQMLTLVAAVAVTDAIKELAGIQAAIKWPNDILLNGKKACGILVEAVWQPPALQGAIVGIGINVGAKAVPTGTNLRYPPTSLEDACGFAVQRESLLVSILQSFFQWLPHMNEAAFRSHYQNHLAFIGEWVNIINSEDQSILSGQCMGISQQGSLMLQQTDGTMIHCTAGEISLRQNNHK